MPAPRNYWNLENADEESRWRMVTSALKDTYNLLNRGFTLKDNAKGSLITVDFALANTEVAIRHGLDFVPSNYLLTKASVAMSVYDGSTAADKTSIYLKSSAAGQATLFLF